MFDNFLDVFARYCLKLGHITFIFPIVVVFMIFSKKDTCAKAACFLVWVMIFNTLLKLLFKVPLFPHLGHGYAFPSGHMHASAAFYGFILYKTNNRYLKTGLGILLCLLGFSLIHCHFHDLKDVLGALGFATAELFVYHNISTKFGDKVAGMFAIISAIAVMIALSIIHKVEFHVWLAFYALVGMELALYIAPKNKLNSLTQKFLALAIATSAIFGVYHLFKFLAFDKFYLSEIRFFIVPFMIVGSRLFVEKLKIKPIINARV